MYSQLYTQCASYTEQKQDLNALHNVAPDSIRVHKLILPICPVYQPEQLAGLNKITINRRYSHVGFRMIIFPVEAGHFSERGI
ncbi:MAG: hypothetical protein P0107_02460 [Nitrosomonas sp.]|nr:hypothetical protein [Nitrosomonas sp.]